MVDTRSDLGGVQGPLQAGSSTDFTIAGATGIPSDASSIVGNLTVTDVSATGYVQMIPQGQLASTTSTINVTSGDIIANIALVSLGSNGKIAVKTSPTGGTLNIILDIVGWYGPTGSYQYSAIAPVRAYDSRPNGITAGTPVTVSLAGVLPAGATSAAINLTAVNPTTSMNLAVAPAGAPQPATSVLNAPAGAVRANMTVVSLGANRDITIWNSAGQVDVLVDVLGWFGTGALSGTSLISPSRILDTRITDPNYQIGIAYKPNVGAIRPRAIGAGETLLFKVAQFGGVPSSARGVVLNATGLNSTTATHIVVWKAGQSTPSTSNVNLGTGQQVQAFGIPVDIGTNGYIAVYNNSGNTDLLLDDVGWYA